LSSESELVTVISAEPLR